VSTPFQALLASADEKLIDVKVLRSRIDRMRLRNASVEEIQPWLAVLAQYKREIGGVLRLAVSEIESGGAR